MPLFNEYGYLFPYEGQQIDLPTFQKQFVNELPASRTRATLYQGWIKYNELLRNQIGESFEQWINGSFITGKLNPNDIDIVSFIPSHRYDQHEAILDKFWSDNWENEGIDTYIVKVYRTDDPRFMSTKIDKQQWVKRFLRTKPNADFVSYPKGFLTMHIL